MKEISSLWRVDITFDHLMLRSMVVLDDEISPNTIETSIFNRVIDERGIDPSTIKDISMVPLDVS